MKSLRAILPGAGVDLDVLDVTCDSRRAGPGSLFFAFRGAHQDGHDFARAAVAAGACAVVAERPVDVNAPVIVVPDARRAFAEACARFHGDPTARLNVVGVTGTNGKTTTTWILRSIFEAAGERAGLIGTIEYRTPLRAIPAGETTPGPDRLQALFAECVRAGARSCAIEVSSHALAQDRVHAVRFAAGVFTSLSRDHLDYHGSLREYLAAKRRLFEMLSARGVAAIHMDDPAGPAMAQATAARVIPFGLSPRHEVGARIVDVSLAGTNLVLRLGSHEVPVQTRLIGAHNVVNILGAAAAAWGMGYDIEPIRAGIEALAGVPGRLERVDAGDGPVVLVDYAHTEDALRHVLSALRPVVPGRLFLVFGCGGDRDAGKRPAMGRTAEELADVVVVTSDNPRSEPPMEIIRQILAGMVRPDGAVIEPDRARAIRWAVTNAREGDAVLIAGKGHETTQIVGAERNPFDDREIARKYLRLMERR